MRLLKGDPKIKSVGDPELRICNLLSHCSSSNKITSAHASPHPQDQGLMTTANSSWS